MATATAIRVEELAWAGSSLMSPALPAIKAPLVLFLSVTTSLRALKILDQPTLRRSTRTLATAPGATLWG